MEQQEHWALRRDLERRLHDGPALRVSALALRLGMLRQRIARADAASPSGLDAVREDIDALQDEVHGILQDFREIADRIYPPLLHEAGLGPALAELVNRSGGEANLDAGDTRYGASAEGIAYFTVARLLVAEDGGTAPAAVRIRPGTGVLVLELTGVDDRYRGWLDAEIGGTTWHPGETGAVTVRIPCE